MRNLAPRERRLAVFTAVVVGSALIYVGVLEPVGRTWLETYGEAYAAEERLAQLKALASRQEEIDREYARLTGEDFQRGDSNERFSVLLNEIETLGRRSGFVINSIKPLGKTDAEGVVQYGVELVARGEARQFLEFLRELQDPKHLLVAEKISLLVGRTPPRLTLTFQIRKAMIVERPHG